MGCFNSRFQSRNESALSMHTVSVNFMGGVDRFIGNDLCPVDKLVLNYCSKKSNLPEGACKEICELAFVN